MLFKLEDKEFNSPQTEIARTAFHFKTTVDNEPFSWATSPFGMEQTINRVPKKKGPNERERWRYHIVHGSEPWAPLCEAVARLKEERIGNFIYQHPSPILTRNGSHWMLVVGAKVENGSIVWLAVADPLQKEIRFLTGPGLTDEFDQNFEGDHPDWEMRHVAVVASRLPRKDPVDDLAGLPDPVIKRTPFLLPDIPEIVLLPMPASDKDRLLDSLRSYAPPAGTGLSPNGNSAGPLLQPLATAHEIAFEVPVTAINANGSVSSYRLVQIADKAGKVLARATVIGDPPAIASFFMAAPAPPGDSAGMPPWEINSIIENWKAWVDGALNFTAATLPALAPVVDAVSASAPRAASKTLPGLMPGRLVWKPCAESLSPFHPFFETISEGKKIWIECSGRAHESLTGPVRGQKNS
jgi:hypothetical protein